MTRLRSKFKASFSASRSHILRKENSMNESSPTLEKIFDNLSGQLADLTKQLGRCFADGNTQEKNAINLAYEQAIQRLTECGSCSDPHYNTPSTCTQHGGTWTECIGH